MIRENRSPDVSQACPEPVEGCQGPMAVIAFIEAEDVIEKILKHLGLWELTPRPPPRSAKSQPLSTEPHIDYSDWHRSPFLITGFMSTPYLPVRDRTQTGTRWTSCHESRNRNRDAARRVFPAFFRSKRRLSVNRGVDLPRVHSGLYQPGTPPPTERLWCPT